MLCVIRSGIVFATHQNKQFSEIKDAYTGMEIIQVVDNFQFRYEYYDEEGRPIGNPLDPRGYGEWQMPDVPPEERITQLESEATLSAETLSAVGQELAQEKIKNMQKDGVISTLGQELAAVKLELMKLKRGV
ncbi:hypothetical protein J31TS6_14040 [Brevibacillus reuszeri]|uniref:XkdW family protein n=1 Tax=Brevibacillus reuszeri TaxID=54915 RepID=UPI001B17BBC0|nr:XkdW family protein [Brevibacillus reuszeri]GIO05376.1 hypothetical protein J31TS6_14040 [Brevibacillus reuszeri]